jgi:hypothetical protein
MSVVAGAVATAINANERGWRGVGSAAADYIAIFEVGVGVKGDLLPMSPNIRL